MKERHRTELLRLSRQKQELQIRQHTFYMAMVDFWLQLRKEKVKRPKVKEMLKESGIIGYWQMERYYLTHKAFTEAGYTEADIINIDPSQMLNALNIKKLKYVLQTLSPDVVMQAIREMGLAKMVRIFGEKIELDIRKERKC